jgi:hypothetical protein
MRIVLVFVATAFLLIDIGRIPKRTGTVNLISPAKVSAESVPKARVDFESQLKPIFQSKCMPCHFSGGKVYDRMPFDKPETIRKLGTKLFTRIKDEHDRQLINEFLAQTP